MKHKLDSEKMNRKTINLINLRKMTLINDEDISA